MNLHDHLHTHNRGDDCEDLEDHAEESEGHGRRKVAFPSLEEWNTRAVRHDFVDSGYQCAQQGAKPYECDEPADDARQVEFQGMAPDSAGKTGAGPTGTLWQHAETKVAFGLKKEGYGNKKDGKAECQQKWPRIIRGTRPDLYRARPKREWPRMPSCPDRQCRRTHAGRR